MTTYLLPCECTADVAVSAGQAGGSVACPHCGRMLDVPKLRDLGRLQRQTSAGVAGGGPWRPAHGVALLGAIVAVAAWAAGMWFAPEAGGVIDERALRSAVLAVDDLVIYKVWAEELSHASARRPPADEEKALLRRAQFADGVRSILQAVSAVAAVAAAAAALRLWWASRLPGEGAPGAAGSGKTRP